VQAAVAKRAKPADIVQPGHIFPLMAQNGGVLVRAGHTEAGCDLAQLAGCEPAAVICEILKDDGTMARLPDLIEFAENAWPEDRRHRRPDPLPQRERDAGRAHRREGRLLRHGDFHLIAYRDKTSGDVHLALVKGEIDPRGGNPGAGARADHRARLPRLPERPPQLQRRPRHAHHRQAGQRRHRAAAPRQLDAGPAGRPAGRSETAKPAAKWDPRLYGIGAQILRDLGVRRMKLLASPRKMPSMAGFQLEITGYLTPDDAKA
jgi:3,4-dihydroxy 2-butanone 4-phosphate synthase/GTP cyclohydrolase II